MSERYRRRSVPLRAMLAAAGLVSVHDRTWTTGRTHAARRWSELEPGLAAQLGLPHSWASHERCPAREETRRALAGDGIIAAITGRFATLIGLWPDDPAGRQHVLT